MIYLTGDIHGYLNGRIREFIIKNLKKEDIFIILGDSGINYYLNGSDKKLKKLFSKFECKFFIVHGNHEEYPENINSYLEKEMFNGKVFYEKEFPNLIFAKDGEQYTIENKKFLVLGGAYSVDKNYRITMTNHGFVGYNWFKSEQMDVLSRENVLEKIKKDNKFDYILTHTCPKKYIPKEAFLKNINQDEIDDSMEEFLDKIQEMTEYNKWYCGHFHIDKDDKKNKIRFLFSDIIKLE